MMRNTGLQKVPGNVHVAKDAGGSSVGIATNVGDIVAQCVRSFAKTTWLHPIRVTRFAPNACTKRTVLKIERVCVQNGVRYSGGQCVSIEANSHHHHYQKNQRAGP